MNKGFNVALLPILSLVLSVMIVGTIFNILIPQTNEYQRTNTEVVILEAINLVESAKQSLNDALKYSFYQASYDVSKNSGYSEKQNIIPVWRKYQQTFLPNYVKNLQDLTLKFLNEYVKALKDPVSIPDFNKVEIEKADSKVLVKATTDGKLEIKGENLTYSDNADIEERININTLKIFEIGKENFVDKDSIKIEIENAISEIPDDCKKIHYADCNRCFQESDADNLLNTKCSDWKNKLSNLIKSKLTNLQISLSSSDLTVQISNIEIKSSYKVSWDDCKRTGANLCEYTYVGKCKEPVETDQYFNCATPSGGCSASTCASPKVCFQTDCCEVKRITYYTEVDCLKTAYQPKLETDINYDYKTAVRALIEVKDKTKHPVYDTTTDMRNFELKFYVVSGNSELI